MKSNIIKKKDIYFTVNKDVKIKEYKFGVSIFNYIMTTSMVLLLLIILYANNQFVLFYSTLIVTLIYLWVLNKKKLIVSNEAFIIEDFLKSETINFNTVSYINYKAFNAKDKSNLGNIKYELVVYTTEDCGKIISLNEMSNKARKALISLLIESGKFKCIERGL